MKHWLYFLFLLYIPLAVPAQKQTALESSLERQGLVDLQKVDKSIFVDLMYTRADNFTGKILYTDLFRGYLHPEAAKALHKAQQTLKAIRPDLSLKVYDAARPMRIQQKMWNTVAGTPQHIYVSNPRNGGGLHNYGLAVDVTLCDAATGDSLPMGTKIDELSKMAHVTEEERMVRRRLITPESVANRRLLRKVMGAGGFKVLPTEWWHFNLRSRAEAKARYSPIR